MSSRAWIVFTGSRTLTEYGLVAAALDDAWHDATQDGYNALTIVHGAARGADSLAERWWKQYQRRVRRDRFPADWDAPCVAGCRPGHRKPRTGGGDYCPAEGSYRNQRMIDHVAPYKPDVLLIAAFATPKSDGTLDCLRRGIAAGIPYRLIGDPPTLKEILK